MSLGKYQIKNVDLFLVSFFFLDLFCCFHLVKLNGETGRGYIA